ncbi:MAG TPA: UbiA family prenyltransferase, partial [Vicinamibacteria bacterium]|nr:UbiA family prenyltransferase [Vicinamibacteria bacterium]
MDADVSPAAAPLGAPRAGGSRWRAFGEALRLGESLLLLGIPVLGLVLAGGGLPAPDVVVLLLAASFLGAAHFYALNDTLGYPLDRHDPGKAQRPLIDGRITRGEHLAFTVALGLLLYAFLARFAPPAVFGLALGIEAVWMAYEWPGVFLKRHPVAGTLCTFAGTGFLPFLVGWAFAAPLDGRALSLALWTGAVAAAGQINRELVDAEADRRQGVGSTAAWLGPVRAHDASFAAFAAATAYLAALLALDLAPAALVIPVALTLPAQFVLY